MLYFFLLFFFQTICAFKGKEIRAGPWSQKEPWLQELRSYIQMVVVTGLIASVQEIKTPIQWTSCVHFSLSTLLLMVSVSVVCELYRGTVHYGPAQNFYICAASATGRLVSTRPFLSMPNTMCETYV